MPSVGKDITVKGEVGEGVQVTSTYVLHAHRAKEWGTVPADVSIPIDSKLTQEVTKKQQCIFALWCNSPLPGLDLPIGFRHTR
jgi:hypothetical protein